MFAVSVELLHHRRPAVLSHVQTLPRRTLEHVRANASERQQGAWRGEGGLNGTHPSSSRATHRASTLPGTLAISRRRRWTTSVHSIVPLAVRPHTLASPHERAPTMFVRMCTACGPSHASLPLGEPGGTHRAGGDQHALCRRVRVVGKDLHLKAAQNALTAIGKGLRARANEAAPHAEVGLSPTHAAAREHTTVNAAPRVCTGGAMTGSASCDWTPSSLMLQQMSTPLGQR
jgi:hypothetical protein